MYQSTAGGHTWCGQKHGKTRKLCPLEGHPSVPPAVLAAQKGCQRNPPEMQIYNSQPVPVYQQKIIYAV
jgi:hypothetical protein